MKANVGVVLSGGGARGAYEAGVLRGIAEAVKPGGGQPLFQVVAGTSVGALNGAWLAANAHRPDHDMSGLVALWTSLKLKEHLRFAPRGLCRGRDGERFGPSLLDPAALEAIAEDRIDWTRLHANLAKGELKALVLAALHVGSGVTTLFAELAPGAVFRETVHPRRAARLERLSARHLLASAALPGLYPARRIGSGYFADGGLRFNTPISPALRAGADHLVVITLRHRRELAPDVDQLGAATEQYPSVLFLAGKVLNALLLDPVADDLQTLLRFNQLVHATDEVISPAQRAMVDERVVRARGVPYREIDTLVFEPSQNIGLLAAEYLRDRRDLLELSPVHRVLFARAAEQREGWEADLASYLLFDGDWARALIELGRADVRARAPEVGDYFARCRALKTERGAA